MASIEAQCPITYFEKNLIFSRAGSCYAAYKLTGFNYDFKSAGTKIDTLVRQVSLLKNLTIAKLMIVPTTEPVEAHANKIRRDILAKNQSDSLVEAAQQHLRQTCEYLDAQSHDSWRDYTCYLLVKLQDAAPSQLDLTIGQIAQAFCKPLYTATVLFGLTDNEIPVEQYRKYTRLEVDNYKLLSAVCEMGRATASEVQWLLKRSVLRGTGKTPQLNRTVKTTVDDNNRRWHREYTTDWAPSVEHGKLGKVEYYRPNKADVANLFEGRISCNGSKGVKVAHADGTVSYQSYIVLTSIPDALQFPGCEWIYELQQLPLQLEICVDVENISNREAKDVLNRKGTEINTQYENVVNANAAMPTSLGEAQQQLDTLRKELDDNKLPMSSVRVSICLASSDEQQVENDVTQLIGALADLDFTAVRPIADQLRLFYQHLPGTGSYAEAFTRKISPFMLACGIFGASNTVGDDVGYYIGYANDKPVWLRLGHACLSDSSPAGMLIGGLGQGKSFCANIMLFVHVLCGAYGLVICPKGERSHWRNMPILGSYVNLVEFSPDPRNKGKLDPYNIFRGDINEASALATDVLLSLLEVKPNSDESIILMECINQVREAQLPSMEAILTEILQVPKSDIYFLAAQKLHRILQALKRSGMIQLFFGDGSEQAIDINGRLNVIMLNGISLPAKDTPKEKYTQPERHAALLMSVLASISKKFATLHPGREKITLIDESWAITPTESGSALIEHHARMGRSQFHVLLLNGHSVQDLPSDKIKGTITYKFFFNPKDKAEALRMLDFMRLDKSAENVNKLLSLRQGECLFSDLDGRVAKLKFDPVFDEIFNFFLTTPTPDDDRQHELPLPGIEEHPLHGDTATDIQDDELDARIAKLLGDEWQTA